MGQTTTFVDFEEFLGEFKKLPLHMKGDIMVHDGLGPTRSRRSLLLNPHARIQNIHVQVGPDALIYIPASDAEAPTTEMVVVAMEKLGGRFSK